MRASSSAVIGAFVEISMRLIGYTLVVGCFVANGAVAAGAMGAYVSVGVGRADVRAGPAVGIGPNFREPALGWTASLGIRPVAFAGAELQYFDFGHPNTTIFIDRIDVQARTPALFAVGYVPLPVSFLDLYAKAGLGRVHVTTNGRVLPGVYCFRESPECRFVHTDTTGTRFGWGTGALLKLSSSLAIRAEYARFSVPSGDPDLLSLSLTWTS